MEPLELLKLQEHDLAIVRLERELEELPEKKRILEIRRKKVDVEAVHGKADALIAKLEADLKRAQDEIATLDEKISSESSKMMQDSTGNHKRVQLLQREIDGLSRRKDKLENDSLALMERLDKAKAQRTTIEEALKSLDAKESSTIQQFQKVGGDIKRSIAEHATKRDQRAAAVPGDLLARYEKVRAAKGGVGIGRLDGEVCTACRMELPIERARELREGPDIGVCPQCRRLIVVRGAEDL